MWGCRVDKKLKEDRKKKDRREEGQQKDEDISSWVLPEIEPTPSELKAMIAMALKDWSGSSIQ